MALPMIVILLAASLLHCGYCYLPKFRNCQSYSIIPPEKYGTNLSDPFPFGFYEARIPHPQDDPNLSRANPCFTLSGLTDTIVEILAEPLQAGAPLCVQEHTGASVGACAAGRLRVCHQPSADSLNFEFFCRDSCQSSDVSFKYRFVVSAPDPSDSWCDDRPPNYPSDLAAVPVLAEPTTRTPAPGNAGVHVTSSMWFVLFLSIAVAVRSYFDSAMAWIC